MIEILISAKAQKNYYFTKFTGIVVIGGITSKTNYFDANFM